MISQIYDTDYLLRVEFVQLALRFYSSAKLPGVFIPEIFHKNWKKLVNDRVGALWVNEVDGKITGAFGGLIYPCPYDDVLTAQEMFWFVAPEARGGVGAIKLYHAFEIWAENMGAKRVFMANVFNESTEALRAFYIRRGYRPMDVSYFKQI